MRSPLIAAALGLLLLADMAQAHTLVATSNIIVRASQRTIDFTSDTTTSIRDSKIIREAHDDAASFVASDGDIRGANLEAAFNTLRTRVPEARDASDQVLAEAILALCGHSAPGCWPGRCCCLATAPTPACNCGSRPMA